MLLQVYPEEAGKINIRKIAHEFIARKDSRKEQFRLMQVL